MRDYLEIKFWQFGIWLLKSGYGYCEEKDYEVGCICCTFSEVQRRLAEHIELIKSFRA
jgi:hypothetical protein